MDEEKLIDKIDKVKTVSKTLIAEETVVQKTAPANKDYFDALMKQGRQIKVAGQEATQAVEENQKTTLLDEVKNASTKVDPVNKSNPSELIAQSKETIERIGHVKEVLSTSPDINIRSSYKNLLKNKLTHIDESLKIALSKAGAEYTSEVQVVNQGLINPIEKYLGYLTHSQDQLMHLSEQIQAMHDKKKEISPANMLAIQIKVGYIQQELEFFISLLNKALESTKTLMNVQV